MRRCHAWNRVSSGTNARAEADELIDEVDCGRSEGEPSNSFGCNARASLEEGPCLPWLRPHSVWRRDGTLRAI
jgi:hypothetical protein